MTGKHNPRASDRKRNDASTTSAWRARKNLTLCELETMPNPHTDHLKGRGIRRLHANLLTSPPDEALCLRYERLDLSSLWLSYPAKAPNASFVRQEIAKLHLGSAVCLELSGERIFITDAQHHKFGALSAPASAIWRDRLPSIRSVHIYAGIH